MDLVKRFWLQLNHPTATISAFGVPPGLR
jgi:hypothetical protein